MRWCTLSTALLATLALVCGCLPSQTRPQADFRANDTPSRVTAIVDAAEQDDQQTLAELVHALSDEDPAVRLFAIQSLIRRTGQDLGYRYYAPRDERRTAVLRWYAYLHGQGIEPVRPEPTEQASVETDPTE